MKKTVDRPPNLRRAYFESRFGQLHCRTAFPSTGGFDELTPLIGLHDAPGSGAGLAPLLPHLGRDRSVYLPDLPGCGHSDAPGAPISIADYGASVGEMLRGLRLREIDVLGVGAGAAVAAQLVLWYGGGVRRLVLVHPSFLADTTRPAAPRPVADGSHLRAEWEIGLRAGADAEEISRHSRAVGERLAGGIAAQWPADALSRWSIADVAPQLTLPTLVLCDPALTKATAALLPRARVEPCPPGDAFAPPAIAGTTLGLRGFLDP